jgi:hypothetical protein
MFPCKCIPNTEYKGKLRQWSKFGTVVYWAGIFKQSMEDRNRIGIGLSYRPARLHRLAELNPWNRFLGSLEV